MEEKDKPKDKPGPLPIISDLEQINIDLERLRDNVVHGSPIHVEELDKILGNIALLNKNICKKEL